MQAFLSSSECEFGAAWIFFCYLVRKIPFLLIFILMSISFSALFQVCRSVTSFHGATLFLYGSYITLIPDNSTSVPLYSNTSVSSSLFWPAYISNSFFNVTLNLSVVQTIPANHGSLRITLSQNEFKLLSDQIFVPYRPYAIISLQYGQPLVSIGLQAYCSLFI
jgi:hypothetical protein